MAFDRDVQTDNGAAVVLSINDAGKIRCPHAKTKILTATGSPWSFE
jgi:hypothetical protein